MQISRLLTGRREEKMSVDITQFIEPPEEYMQASAFADQMLQLHLLGDCAVRACLDAIRLAPSPSIALREWLRDTATTSTVESKARASTTTRATAFLCVCRANASTNTMPNSLAAGG